MAILGNVKTPVTPKLSVMSTFKKEPLALALTLPTTSSASAGVVVFTPKFSLNEPETPVNVVPVIVVPLIALNPFIVPKLLLMCPLFCKNILANEAVIVFVISVELPLIDNEPVNWCVSSAGVSPDTVEPLRIDEVICVTDELTI